MNKFYSFHHCEPHTHKGKSNIWFTPKKIVDQLGKFDLDPCTVTYRPFDIARNHIEFDRGNNGLELSWNGRVFMNPPYGKEVELWLNKLHLHGNGIALVFARTETACMQKHLKLCHAVLFLKGRLRFTSPLEVKQTNAGVGSMLLAYGRNNVDILGNLKGIRFINKGENNE